MHHLAFCQGMTLYLMSMELHLQVREARKQANLTQQELARLAGVSRMDVSRLENGENLTMRMFLKIVNALPSLTHLSLGSVQLTRDPEGPPIHDREQLRARAEELLSDIHEAKAGPPTEQAGADAGAARREQSLLRMFAELLLEITGEKER